jgi:predicted flavoprotein YhiN
MVEISKYDVVILGGGAGGLFCAFEAAKNGNKVLVLEKANKVGKKNSHVWRWSLQLY